MAHNKHNISELVHSAHFPVYGFIDHSSELSICSVSQGYTGRNITSMKLNTVGFIYSSPRYPEQRDNFSIVSSALEIEQPENSSIIYELKDPSEGTLFDFDTYLFQYYHLSAQEQKQAGPPSVWEEMLFIADSVFSAKIRHWSFPHQLSLFLLKGEKIVLSGQAYGPSHEKLTHLLLNLQIINNREDVLREYQYELDQETKRLFEI